MNMVDPVDPVTPSSPPTVATTTTGGSTGLPSNVAAALACIPLIGGIIFYVLEKHDRFVRFYALQSIIFGGAWVVFVLIWNVLFSVLVHIPVLGWMFALILWLVWALWSIGAVVIWVITMFKAFTGVRWDIPFIGPIARNQVDEATTIV
jgi:uncharacterized membrane protein